MVYIDQNKVKLALDLIHSSLPNIRTLHVATHQAQQQLMEHPLWLKLRCIHLDYGDQSYSNNKIRLTQELAQRLAACDQLRALSLVSSGCRIFVCRDELSALLKGLNLRSLNLDSATTIATELPVADMGALQTLKVALTVAQVEQLASPLLVALHTLELTLFEPSPAPALLKGVQLACLARLPALLHLVIHDHERIIEQLYPLQYAQAQDTAAFKQLISYEYHEGSDYQARHYVVESLPKQSKFCFPSLTRLYLAPRPLTTDAFLDLVSLLNNQMPRLQELILIQQYVARKSAQPNEMMSMSWCRNPIWKELAHLETLCLYSSEWTSAADVTLSVLANLRALMAAPNLRRLHIKELCSLNRQQLDELLTLGNVSPDTILAFSSKAHTNQS